jgi:hypothetical protein
VHGNAPSTRDCRVPSRSHSGSAVQSERQSTELATLGDLLRVTHAIRMLPDLPRGTAAFLVQLGAALPLALTRWVHIERHWWPASDRADAIVAADASAASLFGDVIASLARVLPATSDARALLATIARWHDMSVDTPRQVGRGWMEFDAPDSPCRRLPGFFVDAASKACVSTDALCFALARMISTESPARLARTWTKIQATARGTSLAALGALGREGDAESVRMCVAGESSAIVSGGCDAGTSARIGRQLRAICMMPEQAAPITGLVHLDVIPDRIRTVGIELPLQKDTQLRGRLLERPLLSGLVAAGLCPASEFDCACEFAGAMRCGDGGTRVGVRRLNHIKLVFHDGELAAVKAYYALGLLNARLSASARDNRSTQ